MEPALTRREFDVVEQLLRGATAVEVASMLGLSFHTVRTHIRNVYEKLGVANRVELVNRLKSSDQLRADLRPPSL